MGSFILENIITIFFGLTTLLTSAIALHYARLEHRQQVERVIDSGRRAALFLSREAMVKHLLAMYDEAEAGDEIWAQCVRCSNFRPDVRSQILKAAGKGVQFKMIINRYSPALNEFRALFAPLENAVLVEGQDNAMSIQGLSEREVVLSFPGVDSYTAVLIRDEYFVKIVKGWFDARFEQLQEQG